MHLCAVLTVGQAEVCMLAAMGSTSLHWALLPCTEEELASTVFSVTITFHEVIAVACSRRGALIHYFLEQKEGNRIQGG